jgi:hypothetical protein
MLFCFVVKNGSDQTAVPKWAPEKNNIERTFHTSTLLKLKLLLKHSICYMRSILTEQDSFHKPRLRTQEIFFSVF